MTDSLHEATRRGDLDAVRRFVEVEGVDVDCRNAWGDSPLITAVRCTGRTNAPVIRYLISKNANVEATAKNGQTPLMSAVLFGNVDAAKILLGEGRANVNAQNYCNTTALAFASDNPEGFCVVSTLLQYGADVSPPRGRRPLFYACGHPRSTGVAQQLLEHGADATSHGMMHRAAEYSDGETVQLLIEYGADVNASLHCTCWSTPPLARATYHSNASVVKTLLEHNANVDVILDTAGKSLLHMVRDAETCSILLDHCRNTMDIPEFGIFLLREDNDRCIALHKTRSVSIAQMLVEQPRRDDTQLSSTCHAQLVCTNDEGRTPKNWNGNTEVRAYLETFESLVLSIPPSSGEMNTCDDDAMIAVKLNPALNCFQRSVAEEALSSITTTTDCADSVAYATLGYLSSLDVMKRTEQQNEEYTMQPATL